MPTVELKLGEVGRYDATAAAGKIDGIDVLVADAAKLVGKKATVTIGRVLEGQAFATLVASGATGEGPITFESEAEKPTRAPAKRKAATTTGEGDEASLALEDDEAVVDEPHAVDLEDVSLPEGATVAEDAAPEETDDETEADLDANATLADGTTPAKKRTRRGSRGGRRRRKPAGAGAATEGSVDDDDDELAAADANGEVDVADELVAAEAVSEPESANGAADDQPKAPSRRRAPRIHVPGDPDVKPVAPDVVQEAVERRAARGHRAELDVELETEPDERARRGLDGASDAVDDGDAPVVVKRKTRRGSRGGKNRRKKPARRRRRCRRRRPTTAGSRRRDRRCRER